MKPFLKIAFFTAVGVFAFIGLLFTLVFVGMRFGFLNVRGSNMQRNAFFQIFQNAAPCDTHGQLICAWNQTPEWKTVSGGLEKDAPVIEKVSQETGIPARVIAAVVVPEQLRFFTSEREIFKSYFEPLKILGSLSQFSLGVSGVKQETAGEIEKNVPSQLAALIAYTPEEGAHDAALYTRLTNPKDHYYSYLYTALYIKEVEAQWQQSGFDIRNRPGIIATLFNIGFANSKPKADPQVGGAPIDIGGTTYLFGELAENFYNSNELGDIFLK